MSLKSFFCQVASAPVMIGGQAVIEGVMMRGPDGYAVSVRKPDGSINSISTAHTPISRRRKLFGLPVIRGAVSLIEMFSIGMKALEYSATEAEEESENVQEKKQSSKWALALSIVAGVGLGLSLFLVAPNLAAHFVGKIGGGEAIVEEQRPILYNLISGAVRVLLVVGYIWLISFMKDVQRLFRYHGAEHKAVTAFERGLHLTPEHVRPLSRLHPRCGTTFIAIVLIVSIIVFAVFARALLVVWPSFAELSFAVRKTILIFGHILIMPIVAGVCFELLRLGAKYPQNPLLRVLVAPGFWFQRLTTSEPDDSMIEVAIHALLAALALSPSPAVVPVVADERQPVTA